MHSIPSTFTSHPNFASIFDAALESYRRKTKKDLASHPLLPRLQSCDSPDAVLSVFREQISAFDKTEDGFTKWVIPTMNVLHGFSEMLGQAVGLAFLPTNIIFAGIDVLLSATKNASACQDQFVYAFNRIGRFFQRLDIYTGITPTNAMTAIVVEIMVEVINVLAIATKEMKAGRLKRYLKKLTKNTDIEDSLERLDKLTEEEARMAHAELLNVTHSADGKAMGVDNKVNGVDDRDKDVGGKEQDVRGDEQDTGNRVQGVGESVQAVQGDVTDVGNKVLNIGGDIRDISSEVRDVDDKLDQVKRNQPRGPLLRWPPLPDPSINHNIACKAHHGGTAQWFIRGGTFDQWKSSGSLLWIYGKPGSGKTVLCSSIIKNIKDLHDAGKALMAYFYFDFRDVDKQNLRNLLPSLLIQLSAQSNRCRGILSQLFSVSYDGPWKPSDSDMVECLNKMLCFEKQAPTYIIMDALDECPITSTIPSPREEVLEFVKDLVGLHLPNLHICVTSRPEHDIRVVLEPLTEHPVSLHDESGQREDIASYVAFCVDSNRRMRRWREEDKKLVIKTVSEKADGIFQWAFCQLEILRDCLPSSIRRILEELPASLDETYERILKKIRKPNQEHAHRLLQCLAVAARPLRVEELAEVLAFDFDAEGIPELNLNWRWEDREEAVMSTCSSLVIIVEDGDSRIVQFSHFSVKEFLTADRLAEPIRDVSRYHIRLDTAHTVLVRACLGVLLRLDDDVDRDNVKNFPLALYSAQHWTTHAQFQDVSSRVKDGMECLFDTDRPHFATWLWLYNDDQVGRSMYTMKPEKPEATPLYYAASFGFLNLAEHLIAKHPEHVMAKGGEAVTAMHAAAESGHADILSLLLKHGACADAVALNCNTPLHIAAWCAKVDTGKCLLDHGANIDARCGCEMTPLFYAAMWGHVEFVRMLLEREAAIDVRNVTSSSPLHCAAQGGEIQVVRLLLKHWHGAGVNARNVYEETPAQVASGPKRQEIVKLLSEYGAEYV